MESLDCEVCFNRYDEEKRAPRTLSCGHSLCTKCISEGITDNRLSCPFCRELYNMSAADDISVNFTLLKIVRSVDTDANISLESTFKMSPSTVYALEPPVHGGICQDHGSYLLFWCSTCEVWICRDCTVVEHPVAKCAVVSIKQVLSQRKEEENKLIIEAQNTHTLQVNKVNNHIESLNKCDKEIDKHIDDLLGLVEKQKQAKEQVKNEKERAEECLNSGKDALEKICEAKKTLAGSKSVEGVTSACQESQKWRINLENWCKSSEEFNQSGSIATFEELRERVSLAMHVAETFDPATFSAAASFAEFVNKIQKTEHKVTEDELLALLKFSTIWAVKDDDPGAAALVTNEQNIIHLHPLQENVCPPASAVIVKYEHVQFLTNGRTFHEIIPTCPLGPASSAGPASFLAPDSSVLQPTLGAPTSSMQPSTLMAPALPVLPSTLGAVASSVSVSPPVAPAYSVGRVFPLGSTNPSSPPLVTPAYSVGPPARSQISHPVAPPVSSQMTLPLAPPISSQIPPPLAPPVSSVLPSFLGAPTSMPPLPQWHLLPQ